MFRVERKPNAAYTQNRTSLCRLFRGGGRFHFHAAVFVDRPAVLSFVQFGVLTSPFTSFTFTDAIDFAPVGIIVLVWSVLAVRHAIRPHPEAWIRFARSAAYFLAVLPPMVYLTALYIASYFAYRAIGHFPQALIDDAANIASHDDAAYQQMYHVVNYTKTFVGVGVWAWAALLLHLRRRLTLKDWGLLVGLFVLAWVVFIRVRSNTPELAPAPVFRVCGFQAADSAIPGLAPWAVHCGTGPTA